MKTKPGSFVLIFVVIASLGYGFMAPQAAIATLRNSQNILYLQEPLTARMGAWVDQVVFSVESDDGTAITKLRNRELDVYAEDVADLGLRNQVAGDANLEFSGIHGAMVEISFNPTTCTDTSQLNPFANPRIREATNWLVDRYQIVEQIYGGYATAKWLPMVSVYPDYLRYEEEAKALEASYGYDFGLAQSTIESQMMLMGAYQIGGKWHYAGNPIVIKALIRVEDERTQVGDYFADQLEAIGFSLDRQYKTSSEAYELWVISDPAECLWHTYTGGWISGVISRDDGADFSFFYTPNDYVNNLLFQAYTPTAEFNEIALKLRDRDYTLVERDALFAEAMQLSLVDEGSGSVRIWLADKKSIQPRHQLTSLASDLGAGIAGSDTWPYTVRFDGQEGGAMRIAQAGILTAPWNPLGGSSWLYDQMAIRGTADEGRLNSPRDGLPWAQRLASAQVVARDGLPITKTLDWVDLQFASEIQVPGDAWVDWDAVSKTFITSSQKYSETQTANVMVTVQYPADLFTKVKWHDGSPLSVGDFVMKMIMTFDPVKPDSPIYNPELWWLDQFQTSLKGIKIVSVNPLTITTYLDNWELDAERCVVDWWPNYGYNTNYPTNQGSAPAGWHNLAVGIRADANGQLAFTEGKAKDQGIPWMDYIQGSSLAILQTQLNQAQAANYIPYSPTLGLYVTPAEATARYANLQAWAAARGHFWLGTGPFYLASVDPVNLHLTLNRDPNFPDLAGKWDHFMDPIPSVALNHTSGSPGSFFTLSGENFPVRSVVEITINGHSITPSSPFVLGTLAVPGTILTDASGRFQVILTTAQANEGLYDVTAGVIRSKTAIFVLDEDEPLRAKEGDAPEIVVPAESGNPYQVYLPATKKK